MLFAKISAVLYVVWGLVHIRAAVNMFKLGKDLEPGLVKGKINQGAWDVLLFALFAMGIAVTLNWQNAALGYWLNLILVSAADVGFVIFVLVPGYMKVFPGIVGPVFWLSAALFSTLGYLS